jgi:hypothetical protein
MAHFVPVARWFGFCFGYAIAEAVAMAGAFQIGGWYLVSQLLHYCTIGIVIVALWAFVRTLYAFLKARMESRSAIIGTLAKSESQTSGTGEAGTAGRLN